MMTSRVVRWRSLAPDEPGQNQLTLAATSDGWELRGEYAGVSAGQAARAQFVVTTDAGWVTRDVTVAATIGAAPPVTLTIARDDAGTSAATRTPPLASGDAWFPAADFAGLSDIDLSFSPATNTLPLHRNPIAVGETLTTTAVWLRFPELDCQRLTQAYTRRDALTYDYVALDSGFTAVITVDDDGLVRDYEGLFERVPNPD